MNDQQRSSAIRFAAPQQPVRGTADGAFRALQQHLQVTAQRIEELGQELASSREKYHQVCEERNDLLRRIATLTADHESEAASETEWRRIKGERDQLRVAAAGFERETELLRVRASWLEREWVEERTRREAAEQDIYDLAARVDQLEGLVEELAPSGADGG